MRYLLAAALLSGLCWACGNDDNEALPYYGYHELDAGGDTIYHTIPDFSFIDQDSQVVTNATFAGKVYVADFFFTSCPTICPAVKKQMLRIHDKYRDDERVMLLSHTIDTKRDTVGRLKQYAAGLGLQGNKWRFVTGNKDSIYDIARDYISTVLEDSDAPGGFNHSGYILLIDENRHIRAFANGTQAEDVDVFMEKMDKLLAEKEAGGQ